MVVGELFVKLGLKGDADTNKKVKNVEGGLSDVKKMSLQAKAAIIGVVYGLQKLMTGSMNNGVALQQFANYTGLSTKSLQQYQYAAKMAGISGEEITTSVLGMQQAFAQLELNQGPIEYMGWFGETLRTAGREFDPRKMKDAFYTMQKMREFVEVGGTGKGAGVDNQVLGNLGASQGMIAGLRSGAFNDAILNSARIVSDSQSKALVRMKAQWTDLADHIEKKIGSLGLRFGSKIIPDLKQLVVAFTELISSLLKLADKLELFDRLAIAIGNIANGVDLISGFINEVPETKKPTSKDITAGNVAGGIGKLYGGLGSLLMDTLSSSPTSQARLDILKKQALTPTGLSGAGGGGGGNTFNNNQTLNFNNPDLTPQDVGREANRGALGAYQQFNTPEVRQGGI